MMGTYNYVLVYFRKQLGAEAEAKLPLYKHAIAGLAAGITASFVAAPVEQIKAKLQVQYDAATKRYTGPIDCARQIINNNGLRGLYQGLPATLLYRSFFSAYMTTYEMLVRQFSSKEILPKAMIPFISGGCGATVFWMCCLPFDTIKNRIVSQPDVKPRAYPNIAVTAQKILAKEGWRGFYRGFVPCIMRSFPTNGAALWVFDFIMRTVAGDPTVQISQEIKDGITVHSFVEE